MEETVVWSRVRSESGLTAMSFVESLNIWTSVKLSWVAGVSLELQAPVEICISDDTAEAEY